MKSLTWVTLLLLAALGLVAVACGSTTTPAPTPAPTATAVPVATPSATPVVVTDSNGNRVTIEEPPQRIIAFDSAAVEILFAIGEGHRIVGTHAFVSYPPEVEGIARVGDAFNMNLEQVVALEPDLVYVYFDRFVPDLEKLGLKVLYIKSLDQDMQDVADHFRLWGEITGNLEAAEGEVAKLEARLEVLRERLVTVEEGPRVYHHDTGFWTPGGDTLNGRIYALMKAKNIAQDISGWAQISPEVIVDKDPEVVIAASQEALEEFNNIAAFRELSAVKSSRVFAVESDLLSVAGPRLIEGIESLARLIYPDLFQEATDISGR